MREEQIEVCAKALYAFMPHFSMGVEVPWSKLSESAREIRRQMVIVVLTAAMVSK